MLYKQFCFNLVYLRLDLIPVDKNIGTIITLITRYDSLMKLN